MPDTKELIDILSLAPLERYALLGSRDGRRKAFACYYAMREKISSDFLPAISSREPFINDHSRGHLERVLAHIESILEYNFHRPNSSIIDIPYGRVITWADTLILLNALVWHDIGNIFGRQDHAKRIRECFDHVANTLYDDALKQHIIQVAQAHSGDLAIDRIIPDSHAAKSYQGEDIHLQFLAAVLRFADELDEDHRRIAPQHYQELDLVPERNRRYWFFSKSNSSLKIKADRGQHNIDFWLDVESHVPWSAFSTLFETDKGPIEALAEYFRRVLKIDTERTYCNRYLRTAYYHPGVTGMRVRLMTHEKAQLPTSGRVFTIELSESKGIDVILASADFIDLHEHIRTAIDA